MPGTTTRGFPYVQGSDNANTMDETTQLLAERCRDEYSEGTFASRPAAGTSTAGRIYYATDTGDYWRDTGSGWRFERATARTIAAAGASASHNYGSASTTLPLGALGEESVSGAFSRVTRGGGHTIRCAFGGLYQVSSAVLQLSGNATSVFGPGAYGFTNFGTGQSVTTYSALLRFSAGGDIYGDIASIVSGSVSAQVLWMTVQRVAP